MKRASRTYRIEIRTRPVEDKEHLTNDSVENLVETFLLPALTREGYDLVSVDVMDDRSF